MVFKKTGIPKPTQAQIDKMAKGTLRAIVSDATNGYLYYYRIVEIVEYLQYNPQSNGKTTATYRYYFADHEKKTEGWYLCDFENQTETAVTEELGFDVDEKATIHSASYLAAICTDVPLTIQLNSMNKIQLSTNGKYCYNDILIAPNLQEKTATVNGEVTPDENFSGLSKVTVEVPETEVKLQEKSVSENGEVIPDEGFDGLSKVTVNIPNREIFLQEKSATPNSDTQTITADANFDGLSKVTVNPVSIDSNNTFKSNGTFSSTGNSYFKEINIDVQPPLQPNKTAVANGVVTADAGYYGLQQVTVSIPDTELYDNLTVEPKLETQVINASDYDAEGFTKVTVNGVQGYLRDAAISPSTIEVTYNAVDELGYLGYNNVTVRPVTKAIDKNIRPENIRLGVTILNVTGTYEPPITTGDLLAITLQPKYALVGYNYLNSKGNIVAGEMPIYNGSYEEIE